MADRINLTRAAMVVMLLEIMLAGLATVLNGKLAICVNAAVLILLVVAFLKFLFDMAVNTRNRKPYVVGIFMVVNVIIFIVLFANIFQVLGITDTQNTNTQSNSVKVQPRKDTRWDAVYFSTVTWTTLGYGDIVPTERARPIAAIEALCGYFVMGVLISVVLLSVQANSDSE